MARLYANENFPLAVVQELRRLGHDVLTSVQAGKANQATPDADVFEFAIEDGRAADAQSPGLHPSRPQHTLTLRCDRVF